MDLPPVARAYRLPVTGPAAQASSGAGRFTNVQRMARVASTNTAALEAAAAGAPEGLVVVAEEQTAGRGRLGRTWVAPPGATLVCSALLRPPWPLEGGTAFLLTASLALAAREAAAACAGVTLGLKWPNDLLAGGGVGGGKVAGILAEVARDGAVVVGIGCNLAATAGGYPPGATSLEALAGHPVGREGFLDVLLSGLERRYGLLVEDHVAGNAALVAEARGASATLGRAVRVELPSGEVLEGEAVALRDDGRLVVVRRDGGQVVVEAGDVVHLRHAPVRAGRSLERGPGGQVP